MDVCLMQARSLGLGGAAAVSLRSAEIEAISQAVPPGATA